MPSSLDALQTLINGPGYARSQDMSQLALNREKILREMQRNRDLERQHPASFVSGATDSDIANLQSDIENDPDTGLEAQARTAAVQQRNSQMSDYNRPDVTEARQGQENFALKKLLLPKQIEGQYHVEAAKQQAIAQAERDARMFGQQSSMQAQKDQALGQRASSTAQSTAQNMALRQELQMLLAGKAHAPKPGGAGGFFSLQSTADQARIAQLQQQIGTAGGGTVAMVAPDGGDLMVPADRVEEAEALGARRK